MYRSRIDRLKLRLAKAAAKAWPLHGYTGSRDLELRAEARRAQFWRRAWSRALKFERQAEQCAEIRAVAS